MSLWQASSGENIQALYKSITQVVKKICSHAIWIGCVLLEIGRERRQERDGICVRRLLHKGGHAARIGKPQSQTNVLFRVLKHCLLALALSLSPLLSFNISASISHALLPFSMFLTTGVIWNDDKLMLTKPSSISLRRRGMKAIYSQIKQLSSYYSIKYPLVSC